MTEDFNDILRRAARKGPPPTPASPARQRLVTAERELQRVDADPDRAGDDPLVDAIVVEWREAAAEVEKAERPPAPDFDGGARQSPPLPRDSGRDLQAMYRAVQRNRVGPEDYWPEDDR
jgi:hypothetical protein